mmetsp:Transcript_5465/g.13730  ORF Transcript_5465/g.13730 Transcript_5465/m.13730 type:complete len:204 (-) Transcript_5465:233-844(-)
MTTTGAMVSGSTSRPSWVGWDGGSFPTRADSRDGRTNWWTGVIPSGRAVPCPSPAAARIAWPGAIGTTTTRIRGCHGIENSSSNKTFANRGTTTALPTPARIFPFRCSTTSFCWSGTSSCAPRKSREDCATNPASRAIFTTLATTSAGCLSRSTIPGVRTAAAASTTANPPIPRTPGSAIPSRLSLDKPIRATTFASIGSRSF